VQLAVAVQRSLPCLLSKSKPVYVQAKADRVKLQAEVTQKEVELLELPKLDRTRWPAPVAQLVSSQVQAAVAVAVEELEHGTAAGLARLEAELDEAISARADLDMQLAKSSKQLEEAQQCMQRLEVEGREQALMLQGQIRGLSEELDEARLAEGHSLEVRQLRAEAEAAQQRADLLVEQVAGVRAELETARSQALQALWEREQHGLGELADTSRVVGQGSCSAVPSLTSQPLQSAPSPWAGATVNATTVQATSAVGGTGGSGDLYWQKCFAEAQDRVVSLEGEIRSMQEHLADERHTHELRNLADCVRRDEIADLCAQKGRSSVDVEYLKNALLGFFESGELPANTQVLAVLERLLCFAEKDRERVVQLRERGPLPQTPSRKPARSGFSLFG
jgi:hypothetical protein